MTVTSLAGLEVKDSDKVGGSLHQSSSILVKEVAQKSGNSPVSPPPITTSITPVKDWSERATPRAQTRQDFDDFGQERFKKQRSSSLEG